MRYFDYLSEADREALFFRRPQPFTRYTERDQLRGCLGGLLYTPGASRTIAQKLCAGKVPDLTALALCLEDAVGELDRAEAEANVGRQLGELEDALEQGVLSPDTLPLIFLRVKDVPMLERMADLLARRSRVLTGVILPKVTPQTLESGLAITGDIARRASGPFYAMPILESAGLMEAGSRQALLGELRTVADRHYEDILNIRVGATDLSGLYGIRRRPDTPIYSVTAVAACITDVVQIFALGDRYSVSGPVWEYYLPVAQALADNRWTEIDGLLREAALDQQNGFTGKTCAHPSQLLPVQGASVVPWEQYQDASAILEVDEGRDGVLASVGKNKMNECRPHALWAKKILRQARFFGVYRPETGIQDLFRAACKGRVAT